MSFSRRGGFTLLEILLVMAIAIVVAGLVAVSLGEGRGRRAIDHSGTRLVASLRWARERAVLTGRQHRVAIDPAGENAWLEEETDPLDAPGFYDPVVGPWGRPDGTHPILQEGVRIVEIGLDEEPVLFDPEEEGEEGRGYFTFRSDGTCEDGRFVLEWLRGEEILDRIVRIRGFTGRATMLLDPESIEEEADRSESEWIWVAQEASG